MIDWSVVAPLGYVAAFCAVVIFGVILLWGRDNDS